MAFVLSSRGRFTTKEDYSDRKYLRILVKRVKEDGTVLYHSSKYIENKEDRLVEDKIRLMDGDSSESYEAVDTYVLAVNENYKEYPDVAEYLEDGFSSNANYYHKAEVTFQNGKWLKRIYLDWKGNISLFGFLEDLKWELEEALENRKLVDQNVAYTECETIALGMYTEDGDWVDTELDIDELLQSVVGVRVVEFQEKSIGTLIPD